MPLITRDFGHLNEEPLTSGVFEARLDDAKLHGAAWVDNDLVELGSTPRPDLPVDTLAEVDYTRPDGETPAFVSQTMFG